MDATPEQVARRLGTSRRRVVSAARRLGVGRFDGGWLFSLEDEQALRAELGVDAGGPLPRSQMRVLAELSLRPRGLVSARAVAEACGLAPATASAAVKALLADGFIVVRDGALHADVLHPRWLELRPLLREVRPPDSRGIEAA
ncbi:MAG: MarR family transcriptional regulator [Hamadaea sp.]|uniref:winged helix-turn-helix domain-containing protein n=1 Tax=Hamadaea sp. TaxID=2024425 RepID=UPI00182039EB|nr:winged helix-turn-helix domain-containing protein [Hamadaea sp.]NUT23613.1 MarR family transcriptional regulator [Hamadaea sp.]